MPTGMRGGLDCSLIQRATYCLKYNHQDGMWNNEEGPAQQCYLHSLSALAVLLLLCKIELGGLWVCKEVSSTHLEFSGAK